MASTIHVDIVSAEGEIFSGPATMVFAPAVMGEIGIAPRHAPLLTTLKPGEVRVQTPDGSEQFFYVGGGALEVQPHLVTVLADTALRAKDIDEAAALAAKQRAEEALRDKVGQIEMAEALGKTPAQVALNWVKDQPGVTAPIIGVRTMAQMEDNLGSVGWTLTTEQRAHLNEVSALRGPYPYDFIANSIGNR